MAANGFQEWKVDKPWLELKCALGEGPFYEKDTNTLRMVDIKKKQILTVSLDDSGDASSLKTIQLDVCPTVTADIEGVDPQERILIGVKHGLAVLDRQRGTYEMLVPFNNPEHNERIRANDGAADPHGKFWLGTMTDFGQGPNQPEGMYYVWMPVYEVMTMTALFTLDTLSSHPQRPSSPEYWAHAPPLPFANADADGSLSYARI